MLELKYKSRQSKVIVNCFLLHLEQCRIVKILQFRYFGQVEQSQCQKMVEHFAQYFEMGRNKLTHLFELGKGIMQYPVPGRWCADWTGSAQARSMFGQLSLNLPRPQPSKLLKTGLELGHKFLP